MDHDNPSKTGSCIYFVAIAGCFLIMSWLVWYMNDRTSPGPLGEDRAGARRDALKAVSEADEAGLIAYGWVNKEEGIVQIPVERAMELVEQEWHNPAQAREQLIQRAALSFKAPPAPEAPAAEAAAPAAQAVSDFE